jgi:hypothetical protein
VELRGGVPLSLAKTRSWKVRPLSEARLETGVIIPVWGWTRNLVSAFSMLLVGEERISGTLQLETLHNYSLLPFKRNEEKHLPVTYIPIQALVQISCGQLENILSQLRVRRNRDEDWVLLEFRTIV